MAPHKVTATIRSDSPRYAAWVEIFGSDTVLLEGPLPHILSEHGSDCPFYLIDVTSLSDAVRDRLVAHVSREFGIAEGIVRSRIDRGDGVPILADEVTILVGHRHFTRDWL